MRPRVCYKHEPTPERCAFLEAAGRAQKWDFPLRSRVKSLRNALEIIRNNPGALLYDDSSRDPVTAGT